MGLNAEVHSKISFLTAAAAVLILIGIETWFSVRTWLLPTGSHLRLSITIWRLMDDSIAPPLLIASRIIPSADLTNCSRGPD